MLSNLCLGVIHLAWPFADHKNAPRTGPCWKNSPPYLSGALGALSPQLPAWEIPLDTLSKLKSTTNQTQSFSPTLWYALFPLRQGYSYSHEVGSSSYCWYSRWTPLRGPSCAPLWTKLHLLLVYGRPLSYRNMVRSDGTFESILSLCCSAPLRWSFWRRSCDPWCWHYRRPFLPTPKGKGVHGSEYFLYCRGRRRSNSERVHCQLYELDCTVLVE